MRREVSVPLDSSHAPATPEAESAARAGRSVELAASSRDGGDPRPTPRGGPGTLAGLALVGCGALAGLLAVRLDGALASALPLCAVAALAVALRRLGPLPALGTLLAAMCAQNLVVSAFARELSSSGVVAALAAKEVFAVAAAVTGLVLLRGRFTPTLGDRACALYVLVVLGLVAAAGLDGSFASAASVRQALTLPLLYVVGRSLALSADDALAALGLVLRLGLVAAAFGLFERFVLGDAFFVDLGLGVLFEKKGLGGFVFGELPGNFYSWDAGRPVRRLVGVLAEPTSMAHLLAVPVALLVGARSVLARRGPAALPGAVPVAALALTLGKSGLATAAIGAASGLLRQGRAWRVLATAGLVSGLVGFAGAMAASPALRRNVELHTEGLGHLLSGGLRLTGGGFGTAGNFSVALRGDALPDGFIPRESFVAALAGQGGAVAVLAYLVFCGGAALSLLAPRTGGAPADVRTVLAGLVVATALASAASESPAGFLAGGFTFLLAGAFVAPSAGRGTAAIESPAPPAAAAGTPTGGLDAFTRR